jgi:hypothetical protein
MMMDGWIYALIVWAQATSMLRSFDQDPFHVCNLAPAGHAHKLLCRGSEEQLISMVALLNQAVICMVSSLTGLSSCEGECLPAPFHPFFFYDLEFLLLPPIGAPALCCKF